MLIELLLPGFSYPASLGLVRSGSLAAKLGQTRLDQTSVKSAA
jgi:hypothetical protein